MVWKPHVTVAAIIERDKRFLLVEEHTPSGLQFNQPAAFLKSTKTLLMRSYVKSGKKPLQFVPEYVVSIQLWRRSPEHPTFMRVCFPVSAQF